MRVQVEFTVEPFIEGSPGAHVLAAIASMTADGHHVEVGPFSNAIVGEHLAVTESVGRMMTAAVESGATSVSINISPVEGEASQPIPMPGVTAGSATPHVSARQSPSDLAPDPLIDLIHEVETQFGSELHLLDRTSKQRAARMLDDRGAFRFRGAVEEIADAMAVSRVTIYNYLKAVRR